MDAYLKTKLLFGATGLVVGALLSTFILLLLQTTGKRNFVLQYDNNGDGATDSEVIYERGAAVRSHQDRNSDGKWDYFEWYNDIGQVERAECDDNFDGRIDGWISYHQGNAQYLSHDTDFNGIPDIKSKLTFGVSRISLCQPNGSTNIIRVECFRHGVIEREYLDTDGDGLLDVLVTYNKFAQRQHHEKLISPMDPRRPELQ